MIQNHFPGDVQKQPESTSQENNTQENVPISQPNIDRPEGPFKHSGETSRWTEEERKEAEEKEDE